MKEDTRIAGPVEYGDRPQKGGDKKSEKFIMKQIDKINDPNFAEMLTPYQFKAYV